ncbi:MAG: formate dehydrogenase subunit delta [Pseudomonadota bacterium]|nr:formate dehydrogenase subunit delta [Pseudomonadota bacterium]
MDLDNLIVMANRIGAFFAAQPDRDEALAGIADHVKKFWEPRMRAEILAAVDTEAGAALSEIVAAALVRHRAMLQPV